MQIERHGENLVVCDSGVVIEKNSLIHHLHLHYCTPLLGIELCQCVLHFILLLFISGIIPSSGEKLGVGENIRVSLGDASLCGNGKQ